MNLYQGQRLRQIANDQLPITDGVALHIGYRSLRIGNPANRWLFAPAPAAVN